MEPDHNVCTIFQMVNGKDFILSSTWSLLCIILYFLR